MGLATIDSATAAWLLIAFVALAAAYVADDNGCSRCSLAFGLMAGLSMLVMSFNFDNAPTWFALTVQVVAGIEMSVIAFMGWRVIAGHRPQAVRAREEPVVVSAPSVTSLQPYQEGRRRLATQPTAQPEDYLPQPYVA
jgi:hypothetical protein